MVKRTNTREKLTLYLKTSRVVIGYTVLRICIIKERDHKRIKQEKATNEAKHDKSGP